MLVVLPLEVKKREFVPKTFLAYQILKNTNFQVLIGGQRFFSSTIRNFRNVVFFDKNTYHKRLDSLVKTDENVICMLDEEGPVFLHTKPAMKFKYNRKLLRKINKFLFWGNKDLKNINYKLDKNKKSVVGHPKFDILKKPYIKIFDQEVKYIKKKYKKYIFFASSVDLAKDYYINIEKKSLRETYPEKNENFINKELNKIIEYKNNSEKNYNEVSKLLYDLAVKNPKTNIIFRKHPREDLDEVKKRFAKFPNNFILNNDFSITPWIIGCDIYIHSGCTSSLEAVSLKKKIISFIPHGNDKRLNFFKSFGNYFKDKNKCIKKINKLLRFQYTVNYNNIYDYVYNIEKKNFFYKKFINYLKKINFSKKKSEIIYNSEFTSEMTNFLFPLKKKIFWLFSILKSLILKTFLINFVTEKHLYSKKEAEKKFTDLKIYEVNKALKKFKKIDKIKLKFRIKKISESVFLITKKI